MRESRLGNFGGEGGNFGRHEEQAQELKWNDVAYNNRADITREATVEPRILSG
jgi:hypothetical protein